MRRCSNMLHISRDIRQSVRIGRAAWWTHRTRHIDSNTKRHCKCTNFLSHFHAFVLILFLLVALLLLLLLANCLTLVSKFFCICRRLFSNSSELYLLYSFIISTCRFRIELRDMFILIGTFRLFITTLRTLIGGWDLDTSIEPVSFRAVFTSVLSMLDLRLEKFMLLLLKLSDFKWLLGFLINCGAVLFETDSIEFVLLFVDEDDELKVTRSSWSNPSGFE